MLQLKDGRVLNGLITDKTARTFSIRTMTESLTVERDEITVIQGSSASLMPEGLLEALAPEMVEALFAYLMHTSQVAMPSDDNTGRREEPPL